MRREVPLAWRNLLADRSRLAASVAGVGLAVMLVLLLDGMWAGIRAQATVYTDSAGADLYVLQPGVRDLTAGAGALPWSAVDVVRADSGVAWAAPVRTAYVVLQLHGHKVATYLVGSVPGQPGGAWSVERGRAPRADGEIAVGRVVARRHKINVGDGLNVMGRTLRVVGITRSTGFMFDYIFVTHATVDALAKTAGTTSLVAIGAREPAAVADRLRAEGFNVLTKEQVARNELTVVTGIFGSPIRLMVGTGLAAGTLIIALTAYTAVVERRREYGIVAALGARRARLVRLAVGQTLTLGALGLVAGWALFLAGRQVIAALRPQFTILLTGGAVGRAAAATLVMALIAAVVPARRLASLEPAVAYRSAS